MATRPNAQENLMRRYLLGDLPEAEREALEQAYFADEGRLAEVWEVENQLVDDYVRGMLPRAERERFEQHCLPAQFYQERVAFASSLLRSVDAEAAPATLSPSWRERLAAALGLSQLRWGVALATALLLLFAGGWWLLAERSRMQEQLAREREARQGRERELEAQVASEREKNEQLAADLARLRESQTESGSQTPAPRSTIFSFLLTANLTRGSEPQLLAIPRAAGQVELRILLESREHTAYAAAIRAVDGAEVFSQRSLKSRVGRDGASVAVKAPASLLPAGDYILTLTGVSASGQAEEIDRYFFKVRKK
jgi:hypothetical protein